MACQGVNGIYTAIGTTPAPDPEPDPGMTYNSNGTVAGSVWVPWNSYPDTLYNTGDTVTHNDTVYIATADNNHWEPGVFGWNIVPA